MSPTDASRFTDAATFWHPTGHPTPPYRVEVTRPARTALPAKAPWQQNPAPRRPITPARLGPSRRSDPHSFNDPCNYLGWGTAAVVWRPALARSRDAAHDERQQGVVDRDDRDSFGRPAGQGPGRPCRRRCPGRPRREQARSPRSGVEPTMLEARRRLEWLSWRRHPVFRARASRPSRPVARRHAPSATTSRLRSVGIGGRVRPRQGPRDGVFCAGGGARSGRDPDQGRRVVAGRSHGDR